MPEPRRAAESTALKVAGTGIGALLVLTGIAVGQSWWCSWALWLAYAVLGFITLAAVVLAVRAWGIEYRGWTPVATHVEKQESREREEAAYWAARRAVTDFNRGISGVIDELTEHAESLKTEIGTRSRGSFVIFADARVRNQHHLHGASAHAQTHVDGAYNALWDIALKEQGLSENALTDDQVSERFAALAAIDAARASLNVERREESPPLDTSTRRERLLAFVRGLGQGGRGS